MIKIRGLVKSRRVKELEVPVLDGVTLSFPKQGLVVLSGSDRSAKADLLHVIAGLSGFDSGEVNVNGNYLAEMSEPELDAFRNTDLGIIFRESKLRPEMKVYDSLELVLNIQDWADKTSEETRDRIQAILKVVGMEGCERVPISKLTEKERRLVLIARALIKDPKIVLAEEPTANMDAIFTEAIMSILKWASQTRLVIVATEKPEWGKEYADLELSVENGRFVEVEKDSADSIMPPDEFDENITTEEKRGSKRESAQMPPKRYDVQACKQPARDRHRLSRMFRKNRGGLIFMVTLAMIAMLMTIYGAYYNESKLLKAYFNKNQPETLEASIKTSYKSDDQVLSMYIDKGPYYLEKAETLAKETGHSLISTIDTAVSSTKACGGKNFRYEVTLAALADTQQDIYPVNEGHFPINYSQIAITDYLAGELGVSIGDDIETILGRLTVCGIISTDHVAYGLTEKLNAKDYSDFTSYLLKHRYAVGALRKGAFDVYWEHRDHLQLAVFFEDYAFVGTIGRYSRLQEEQLLRGRMPKKPDEVLMSGLMAELYGITSEIVEGGGAHVDLMDIHAAEYNEYYSEYLDLREIFPNGITVVGTYTDDIPTDILVSDEMFEKICDRYAEDYFFDDYFLDCRNVTDYGTLIQSAEELGMQFDEPYADGVYAIKSTIRSGLPIVWCIAGFLGLIAILILEIYFKINVQGNKEYLADLRTLGVTKKDISKIFSANAWGIALICVILTALLSVGVMMEFNLFFSGRFSRRSIAVLVWSTPLTLFLAAVTIIVITMNWLTVKRNMQALSGENN